MVETNAFDITIFAYGERPITELYFIYADMDDIYDLINHIHLADGSKVNLDPDIEKIESIFLEAPFGGPIGYVDFVIITTSQCFFFEVKPDLFLNVEDRLKEQIPRYYHCITDPSTRSKQELVIKLYKRKFGKKAYLVSITGDENYPARLRNLIETIPNVKLTSIGWAPYSLIKSVLDRKGLRIMGISPHIWAEGTKE